MNCKKTVDTLGLRGYDLTIVVTLSSSDRLRLCRQQLNPVGPPCPTMLGQRRERGDSQETIKPDGYAARLHAAPGQESEASCYDVTTATDADC